MWKSTIALKYGLLEDEPDRLYKVDGVIPGIHTLKMTPIEGPISDESSSEEESKKSNGRKSF